MGVGAVAGITAALLGRARIASAAKIRLDPASPNATVLGCRQDGSETGRPSPDQACASCRHFTKTGDGSWGECETFSIHLVDASGWCRVYAKNG